MSNRIYSIPYFPFKQYGLTKETILNKNIRELASNTFVSKEENRINAKAAFDCCACSWVGILKKTATHIFIETKELFDFLSTQEVKEKIPKDYIMSVGRVFDGVEHSKTGSCAVAVIIIHHKYIEKPSAKCFVLFDLYDDDSKIDYSISTDSLENNDAWSSNLLLNTLFYMNAFPGCVIDGTPSEIKNIQNFYGSKKNVIIKTHESLIDRSGVTPHFRSGYFKTLSSKFYKHKRGQVVFVHSTFVKGKAVTVLDDGIGEMQERADV